MAIISSFTPASFRGYVKASIIPFIPPSTISYPSNAEQIYAFLLNPESFTDSKDAHWVKHNIPGLSDPVQQWTYSGPRTITFTALVTRDFKNSPTVINTEAAASPTNGTFSFGAVGKELVSQSGLSMPTVLNQLQPKTEALDLNITDKLNFYKSLTYPMTNGSVVKAPLPVMLSVGTVFGKRAKLEGLFVVDKVEITITKTFSDLTPIEASVAFTLTELVDRVLSSNSDILTNG